MAENAEILWGPQEVGATSRRRIQWALNWAEDDISDSSRDMLDPGQSWSQGSSPKSLKTVAYMKEEPGKERHPSIVESIHLEILQYIRWEETEQN